MKKTKISTKDILTILLALTAVLISLFALREARRTNMLNIDPVMSIQYAGEDEKNNAEFIIKNEGNIDVKNIDIVCSIAFIHEKSEEPLLHSSSRERLSNFLEAGKKISYIAFLATEVQEVRNTPIEKIPFYSHNFKPPFEVEKYLEAIEKKEGDIGKGGMFILFNVMYRRTTDSKFFENTFFFSVWIYDSRIEIEDINFLPSSDRKEYIKKLKSIMPF